MGLYCVSPRRGFLVSARCGKCGPCLKVRKSEYVARIVYETDIAEKTMFLTLTHRPGFDLTYEEVKKFVKRVRKNHPGQYRYFCVFERGTLNGRGHYHLVVHLPLGVSLKKVRACWKGGITHARIVTSGSVALYVAKYLVPENKLTNSIGYGDTYDQHKAAALSEPTVQAALAAWPGAIVTVRRVAGRRPPRRVWKKQKAERIALADLAHHRSHSVGGLSDRLLRFVATPLFCGDNPDPHPIEGGED